MASSPTPRTAPATSPSYSYSCHELNITRLTQRPLSFFIFARVTWINQVVKGLINSIIALYTHVQQDAFSSYTRFYITNVLLLCTNSVVHI